MIRLIFLTDFTERFAYNLLKECIAAHSFGDNFSAYQHESIDNLWLYDAPPLLAWLKSLPHPTALMACDDNQGNRLTELWPASVT